LVGLALTDGVAVLQQELVDTGDEIAPRGVVYE